MADRIRSRPSLFSLAAGGALVCALATTSGLALTQQGTATQDIDLSALDRKAPATTLSHPYTLVVASGHNTRVSLDFRDGRACIGALQRLANTTERGRRACVDQRTGRSLRLYR